MPSPPVNRRLSATLSLAAMVVATLALSANCSSSSLGPANGSSCDQNGDCASNCCLAGGYPPQAGASAKVCSEPAGCSGQDASVASGDSASSEDAAAETGPVDSGTVDSESIDSGAVDSSMGAVDSGAHDTGAPHDAATKG
jgi:hypothetical protein